VTEVEVEYPWQRDEVLDAIRELADREHQRRVWPDPQEFQNFDEVIHWLYDDTWLLEEPELSIGSILRGPDEARALHPLREAVDTLLDTLGVDLTDEEYVASPLWDPVVTAARNALAVLETGRTQVECPARRSQIAYEVYALSSREHQKEFWPDPRRPDTYARAVRVLVDETGVLRDPDAAVGRYLRNPTEAEAMHRLRDALQAVLDESGPPGEQLYAYAYSRPWDAVVDAATLTYAALEAPG